MGYDLPAAVGASTALGKGAVVCLAGDGSIMMNLQELQTIVTNGLPVKIVLINNNGYQQIRLTQTNLFHKNFVGIGADSGDLGFPDFGRVADAFGIPYKRCDRLSELEADVDWMLTQPAYCLLEICCTTDQAFEPKSATKRLDDGRLISPPLEDLAPFLPREELEENMYIPMWEKE
jgi:acetolactate synthase-1/2/3 large subunit